MNTIKICKRLDLRNERFVPRKDYQTTCYRFICRRFFSQMAPLGNLS